jgi:Fe-S-cluster containining protein
MGECSRCGECCRWFPVGIVRRCTKDQKEYLESRADAIDQGYFLVKQVCPYLIEPNEDDLANGIKCECDIYKDRPRLCRIFKGNPHIGKQSFYVPPGCTMRK